MVMKANLKSKMILTQFLMVFFVLLFDWDGSITRSDTLELIAPLPDEIIRGTRFQYYQDAYSDDYNSFVTHFGQVSSGETMYEYMNAIRDVELRSLERIERGGLFYGTKNEQRFKRMSRVEFRDGWHGMQAWLSEKTAQGALEAQIVSVNWSRDCIRHALLQAANLSHVQPSIHRIHSNELETFPGTDVCTGRIVGPCGHDRIVTGIDKLHVCQALVSEDPKNVSVYVGDSVTDLACMLWAQVGILIGPGTSVKRILGEAGLAHLLHTLASWMDLNESNRRQAIVHVTDWNEVKQLLTQIEQCLT
mgnify:FL=1